MTDFLDEKRKEITDRLKELKPMVDEYNRLEAAAARSPASAAHPPPRTRATRGKRGPGRPRGTAKARKKLRRAKRDGP